jgi:hypothetical protein
MNENICIPNHAIVIKYTIDCRNGLKFTTPNMLSHDTAVNVIPIGVKSVFKSLKFDIVISY